MELSPLSEAFEVMFIGLIAVFIALYLVIFIGKIIIKATNAFYKEAPKSVDGKILAVLSAAVSVATKGQGKIADIKKK